MDGGDTAAPAIKDSGARREFGTGAVRDVATGKGRVDLVFMGWPRALMQLARHHEEGAVKYGDNNWLKGIPCREFIASGGRHLLKAMMGRKDEPHFLAAIWNFMCALETYLLVQEGALPPEMADGFPDIATWEVAS